MTPLAIGIDTPAMVENGSPRPKFLSVNFSRSEKACVTDFASTGLVGVWQWVCVPTPPVSLN